MCGICGFVGLDDEDLLRRMADRMRYRGPDDAGFYLDPRAKAGLGCRRLSIIDLEGGHQPITNETGSIVVVQNGEIYNFMELREELQGRGHTFRTRSDTEVIAHAYEEYGEDFCRHLNGDFAIALWDRSRDLLLLARDRLGVHPLYTCQVGDTLIFSSELKSLLCWPKVPREIDPVAVDRYLTLRYVPQGKTLFSKIQKLPPGCLLTFQGGQARLRPYWTLPAAHDHPPTGQSPREAEEVLAGLLQDSVRLRMRSDVPVGAYLSGGLDSSLMVGLMSRMSSYPVRTFAIGFGTRWDERAAARKVARLFGTVHQEMEVGNRDFELLPRIVWHLDEPIGDSIIIPTYRLAQEASGKVKVVVSGEGADEVWGGYIHHLAIRCGSYAKQRIPSGWLNTLGRWTAALPTGFTNRLFPYPATLGTRGKRVFGSYLKTLSQGNLKQEYLLLASLHGTEDKARLYTEEFQHSLEGADEEWLDSVLTSNGSRLSRVMQVDLANWLPDYTLLKQDKLGLANSLEVRVPYLDHRMVEFAAQLPASLKIHGMTTKRLLRRTAARVLPAEVFRAPKRAFTFRTEEVFGEAFDRYIQEILGSSRCRQRGIVSPEHLTRRLRQPRAAEWVENKQLFSLLVLEIWFRTFVDSDGGAG